MDWSQARIIDVSHYQNPADLDWPTAVAQGVVGVIIKFTEGTGYTDPAAADHVRAAIAGGVELIGAYHFGDGSDPKVQARFFLDQVTRVIPLDQVMLMLDAEQNPSGSQMTTAGAAGFAQALFEGDPARWPWLYMGKYGPDGTGSGLPSATLSKCPLVLPAYGDHDPCDMTSSLPPGWRQPVSGSDEGVPGMGVIRLWQFTDGDINGGPYPGLGAVDQSQPIGFASLDELAALWAPAYAPVPVPPPEGDIAIRIASLAVDRAMRDLGRAQRELHRVLEG